ncbi:MAG: YigZ family protein [Bacteroidales bacterium]|nr:YigZ family protein [Bacteroidales bacterium]
MLFETTYKTITGRAEAIFKDKNSKFIAIALPAATEQQAKTELEKIRKQYFDATHHCFAFRIGIDKSANRSSDDGEPSGTAGKPIYNQILSKDLTNILIVVVRYYGGTKLGVSGLINAYKSSAKMALENAEIIIKDIYEIYTLDFNYNLLNNIMRLVKDEHCKIINQNFDNDCNINLKIPKNNISSFLTKTKALNLKSLTFKGIE